MSNGARSIRSMRLAMWMLAVLLVVPHVPVRAAEGRTEQGKSVRKEGAIVGGLHWLALRQVREGAQAGSWPVGVQNYRPAVAALAGLAFLANGHLPGDGGPYGSNITAALKYVMGTMSSDGYIGQSDPDTGMYGHAIGSIFALSCLGMQAGGRTDETLEPKLAEWCRRALDVIVEAQNVAKGAALRGGWHYGPYMAESDISVSCWQMLALYTARQAGFEVDPSVYSSALTYLNSAYAVLEAKAGKDKEDAAGGYFYPDRRVSGVPHHSCTALALLTTSLLNATEENRTRACLTYLRRCSPTWDGPQYGGYFYISAFEWSQGMFQAGGDDWKAFGDSLSTVILDHQSGDGSWEYPPSNHSPEDMRGTGPAYPVAMALLMLSIEKQFLPLFQVQRRFYDSGVTVLAQAAQQAAAAGAVAVKAAAAGKGDSVETSKGTAEPELVVPVLAVPEPSPESDPGEATEVQEGGASDEEDESMNSRPVGSSMFR